MVFGREALVSNSSFWGPEMHEFVKIALTCIFTQFIGNIWFCCRCLHLRMRIHRKTFEKAQVIVADTI